MQRAVVRHREGDGAFGARLLCLLGRHARLGRTVTWDGYDFRSVCRHCGAPLYKQGNVRWRRIAARRDVLLLNYQPDPDAEPWPNQHGA